MAVRFPFAAPASALVLVVAVMAAAPAALGAANGPLLVEGWSTEGGCGPLPRLVGRHAFTSDSDPCDYDGQVHLLGPAGRKATPIDTRGQVAPDGHAWAVVSSHGLSENLEVYRGTSAQRIESVSPPLGYSLGGELAWAPDSRRIAVDASDSADRTHILVFDLRTHAYREVARGNCAPASWSVRGLIACSFFGETGQGIGVVRASGHHAIRRLTRAPVHYEDFGVSWSPDGLQAAFCRGGPRTKIEVVDSDGRHLHAVFTRAYDGRVLWSPDGRYLAFEVLDEVMLISRNGGHAKPFIENARRLVGWLRK